MKRDMHVGLVLGVMMALVGCGTTHVERISFNQQRQTVGHSQLVRSSGGALEMRETQAPERMSAMNSMRSDMGIPTPQPARERIADSMGPVPQPPIPSPGGPR